MPEGQNVLKIAFFAVSVAFARLIRFPLEKDVDP